MTWTTKTRPLKRQLSKRESGRHHYRARSSLRSVASGTAGESAVTSARISGVISKDAAANEG